METQKWYERKWLVFALCVVFFPVGLYGLYKSQSIEKPIKYFIYGVFAVIILTQPFRNKEVSNKESETVVAEDSLTKIKRLKEESIAHNVADSIVNALNLAREKEQQPTKCYLIARRTLKDNLNDRDSYDEDTHKEYFVRKTNKKDPYIQVLIRYRAKNGFGALVLQETVFNFDKSLTMVKTYNN